MKNKASQKVAKREKEVETSASYYSSDDEKSEEEEEVVLKGKANSPAKTFLGEMPALLTLDSSKEKERIPLLSKGSYRAVFAHPVNEGLVWKVGDHSWELCDAQAFQENPRAGEAGQLKVSGSGQKPQDPGGGKG